MRCCTSATDSWRWYTGTSPSSRQISPMPSRVFGLAATGPGQGASSSAVDVGQQPVGVDVGPREMRRDEGSAKVRRVGVQLVDAQVFAAAQQLEGRAVSRSRPDSRCRCAANR